MGDGIEPNSVKVTYILTALFCGVCRPVTNAIQALLERMFFQVIEHHPVIETRASADKALEGMLPTHCGSWNMNGHRFSRQEHLAAGIHVSTDTMYLEKPRR